MNRWTRRQDGRACVRQPAGVGRDQRWMNTRRQLATMSRFSSSARVKCGGVSIESVVLVLVVVTALGFDFTNGFHDTANAMATSIATGALKPKVAVVLSAILNLVGAFLSVEVAITVTNAVIRIQNPDGTPIPALSQDGGFALLTILLCGLAGAIIWNIITWLWGLRSSSSHALFGGLVGATIAGLGIDGVKWI